MTLTQQRIMFFLADRVDARSSEIIKELNISQATFQRYLPDLYEQDFISKTKMGNMHVVRYSLTEDGHSFVKRLIRYQATAGQIVQPARMNKMLGKYEPTQCYQRNEGHREIKSRGFQC